MNCQIVHDWIPRREGWTSVYGFSMGGNLVGYGSVAIAGPWTDRPAVFEFYVLPGHRDRAFDLFEAFLAASDARFMFHYNRPYGDVYMEVAASAPTLSRS